MTYFEESKKYRNVRGFHYGKWYSLNEVAKGLGFTGTKKNSFYKILIDHHIIGYDHEPTYVASISGYIDFADKINEGKIVSYEGTMMIGDLIDSCQNIITR